MQDLIFLEGQYMIDNELDEIEYNQVCPYYVTNYNLITFPGTRIRRRMHDGRCNDGGGLHL